MTNQEFMCLKVGDVLRHFTSKYPWVVIERIHDFRYKVRCLDVCRIVDARTVSEWQHYGGMKNE
jgi:hypothetical protein